MPGRSVPSRRTLLKGAAVAPVAAAGAAACSPGATSASAPTEPVELGAESEVVRGGAKLYRDHNVVVSRDGAGTLKAYSSICTHAGCAINKLEGTELVCPCHGSMFDATTGKVLRAPATEPLQPLTVETKNGKLVAGPQA
ncbi:Rieske (2Fe-2S) protein [Streptomyces griseosporeus]|uniref:Rieske (2Fe-2S) protein n=1 Tax=Streptomyces griseosporeus TaxID=1910 RepID=UPI0036F6F85D